MLMLKRLLFYVYLGDLIVRVYNKYYNNFLLKNYKYTLTKYNTEINNWINLDFHEQKSLSTVESNWLVELNHLEALILEQYFQSLGKFKESLIFRTLSVNKPRSILCLEPPKVNRQKNTGAIFSKIFFSPSNYALSNLFLKNKEITFFKYIHNMSIAVVGPAYSSSLSGNEIDNFDLVVRLNETKITESNKHIIGSRTDIMYLGSYSLNRAIKIVEYYKDLKWIVSKEHLYDSNQVNYRQLIFNPSFILGYPQMLSYLLYDLLIFNPKIIKLFNFDLYLNNNKYLEPNYPNNTSIESFSEHNMISQFIYVKEIYLNGLISVDENMDYLLRLSTEDYLNRFEHNL